jgi:arylsulfatase A-like enzyme
MGEISLTERRLVKKSPIISIVAIAALAAGVMTLTRCGPAEYSRPGNNVILISIDTLRSDHLGCYGYERDTSPIIDRFSEDAVTFLTTYAQSSSTAASHASIFTSLLPAHHGAHFSGPSAMPDRLVTLAECLQDDGCHTFSYNDGGQVSARFGFGQGFDEYINIRHGASGHSNFIHTAFKTIDWLRNRDGGRFFLFLHTYHTHHPYTPPKRFVDAMGEDYQGDLPDEASFELLEQINNGERLVTRSDKAHIVTLYDAEIRQMDVAFGLIVDELKEQGLYDDALIVLTSDHGEEFGEHGTMGWHSHTLYDELLSVPLIIKFPGNDFAGKTVTEQVRSIDIMPTVLDVLDIEIPAQCMGRSLLPLVRGRRDGPRPSVSQRDVKGMAPATLHSGRWKYYRRQNHPQPLLFDLDSNTGELHSSAADHPDVVADLERQLVDILARRPTILDGEDVEIPDELQDQLVALGYAE